MTTTTRPEPVTLTVAEASAALTEAEEQRADVEGRIRAGDPATTPDDLAAADSAVRFASLRLGLAREQEAERAEAERRERVAALRARAAELAGDQRIPKARQAMERAIAAYVAACRDYDHDYGAIYDELSRLEARAVTPGAGIVAGGQTVQPAHPQLGISQAAGAALTQHYPRVQIKLDRT